MSNNEQQQRTPLIKREISVGDIISLVVALAAVFAAYGKLDNRVIVVETTQAFQTKANDSYQQDIKAALKDITEKIGIVTERLPRK